MNHKWYKKEYYKFTQFDTKWLCTLFELMRNLLKMKVSLTHKT